MISYTCRKCGANQKVGSETRWYKEKLCLSCYMTRTIQDCNDCYLHECPVCNARIAGQELEKK
jgi:hypothetical protein